MQDAYEQALANVLKKLKRSGRFESEVRALLRDYPEDVSDRVMEFLRSKRLLNDERHAEALASATMSRRPIGAEALRAKLERQGAPESVVQRLVSDAEQGESERAWRALTAKFTAQDDRARAGRFLYARGFAEEHVEHALDRLFGEGS